MADIAAISADMQRLSAKIREETLRIQKAAFRREEDWDEWEIGDAAWDFLVTHPELTEET
jgi:hypothetical protein